MLKYSTQEECFALENEYHHSGSMQMMPPAYHSQQRMSYSSGTHGSGGWHGHGKTNNYSNGWHASQAQAGWSKANGGHGYNHSQGGGKFPGLHGPAGGRMSSNNTMMSAQFETYHAGPGRMRMQNYGKHAESYNDSAPGTHGGQQKVEWKAL